MKKIISPIFTLLFFYLLTSCTKQITLNSATVAKTSERIHILSQQIRLNSEILDTEYTLINTAGFNQRSEGFGPTDINYSIAIKVQPEDIPKWTRNLTEKDTVINHRHWTKKLTNIRQQNWTTETKPKFYLIPKQINSIAIVYEKEGIIFEQINLN